MSLKVEVGRFVEGSPKMKWDDKSIAFSSLYAMIDDYSDPKNPETLIITTNPDRTAVAISATPIGNVKRRVVLPDGTREVTFNDASRFRRLAFLTKMGSDQNTLSQVDKQGISPLDISSGKVSYVRNIRPKPGARTIPFRFSQV